MTYDAIHKWLRYNYGKPSYCERCLTKDSPKFEYALVKGKSHEKKRENYLQLCASCHKIYDDIIAKLAVKKFKPVYAEKDGKKYFYPSIRQACNDLGILKSSISNNLKGLSKTAGGYIWTIA